VHSRQAIAALSLCAALGAPAASAAQLAGLGTGSIVGTVKDEAGLLVRAVDVTIAGRAQTPRKTTSKADGEYRIVQLPPGDYVLTFAAPAFANSRYEVHVGLGTTVTLDVTLTVAPQREEVVVRGTLDRHSAAVSQAFNARQLASLPGSRNMGGLLAVTPAVTLAVFEVGGGTGIITGGYGAYGRSNLPRHTIEGIVVTGLFGAGFTPDYGSIEEASILTAAHGAEWPSAGIHTDFATKSGSNQYRGTIYAAAEYRRFQASNVDADQVRRGAVSGGGLLPDQVNQLWSNGDLNADVGGFIRKDRLWWYSSVRRQGVAARLVNFPAAPYATDLTNFSGKATARVSSRHALIFYGQFGLNHQPYRLDPFGPSGSDLSAVTAFNETLGSTVDQRNGSWLWKGEWNGIVTDSMVFEVRAGGWGTDSDWTPRSTAPRFEDIVTLVVSGGNRDWRSSARRPQVNGTLSYFTQNRTGRHNFRFGGEALRFLVRETLFAGYPGNVVHVLRDGQPSSVFLFETPSQAEAGLWSWSAYASDAWQPHHRVTLTLGLRFDRYRLFLPAQASPPGVENPTMFAANNNLADWNLLSPRVAAVFDAHGNGRTLLKFSFGRYRIPPNAALGFNSNSNASPWWEQWAWLDPNHSGFFEPGEEGGSRPQRIRGGAATESIDPNLKLPVLDEVGAWLERTVLDGFTLRTGLVWRLERFPSARQNLNQPFEAFTISVPILDRGPDGVAGTGDDGPTVTAYDLRPDFFGQPTVNVVRNVPGASSEYLTGEIAVTRQLRGRWSAGASFAYTWNGDQASNYSGQLVRNNAYPLTPNDLINTGAGGRYEFSTWTAKAHGTFEGPWEIRFTPVLRHQSGQAFGRTQTTEPGQLRYGTVTLLMEPLGSRRMDHITLLDLRIERAMSVKGSRMTAFLDVFNLLNANPEQNVVWSSGSSFLRPVTIVPPRIGRVGLTIDW
jgi:hypothetical protein